jgi:hypothetical protein
LAFPHNAPPGSTPARTMHQTLRSGETNSSSPTGDMPGSGLGGGADRRQGPATSRLPFQCQNRDRYELGRQCDSPGPPSR